MTAIPSPLTAAAHPTEHAHEHDAHAHEDLGFVKKYLFSCDHKTIGIQYAMTALCFLLFGFSLVAMMR